METRKDNAASRCDSVSYGWVFGTIFDTTSSMRREGPVALGRELIIQTL